MRILSLWLLILANTFNSQAQWTTVCGTGNGFVDNFELYNGELYATGFFTTVCGNNANYVVKFDGNNWQALPNGFPNAGHCLRVIDSTLYGVAYQPNIDSNWVYKFDGNSFVPLGEGVYLTNAVTGFSQTANLYSILEYDSTIIACGEFDRVGNKEISGIMQWNGSEWDSLASGLTGNIVNTAALIYPHDLCLFGSDLIVAGNFLQAGGQTVNGIARWDGNNWHAMGAGFNSTVYSIGVYNGELYAGGDFTMSGSSSINSIAKWDGTNWIDPGFSMYSSSPFGYTFIHTLKVLDNKLYIAGGFDRVVMANDTLLCTAIAAYDGISIDTLSGGIAGKNIEAIEFFNGILYAGGGTNNSNSYIARYGLPSTIELTAQDKSDNEVLIFPNPSHNGKFTIVLEDTRVEIVITNMLGQQIKRIEPSSDNIEIELSVQGSYLISIITKENIITRLVLVE